MDLLGDMPNLKCSFEEAFFFYNAVGRGFEYRKAVADYIALTNQPIKKSIADYCARRRGEWAREDLENESLFRRREKKEEERLSKWI